MLWVGGSGGERAAYILSRSRDGVSGVTKKSGVSQKVGASDNGTNCLDQHGDQHRALVRNEIGLDELRQGERDAVGGTAVPDSRAWHLVMAVSIRSSSGWRRAHQCGRVGKRIGTD